MIRSNEMKLQEIEKKLVIQEASWSWKAGLTKFVVAST